MTRSNLVGLLVRNSTRLQVGNYRSEYQYEMDGVIKRRGFDVRVYDEQGISGKSLSARTVTQRMLNHVDTGQLCGIGAEDFKRLTRNEFGIDGGIIAERLAKAGALFHTRDKVYDLRNEDDLLQFQFQCFLSGIDWRSIRNTFWSGVIKAWEKGPIIARRPIGYYSIPLEEPGRAKPRMIPAKNPDHAAVMRELVIAFDECKTMQGVIRHLRAAGLKRPVVRYRGKTIEGWTANGLRDMLDNRIYQGIFESGGETRRDGKTGRSIVWRKFASDPETGQVRKFTHIRPDLAYWTPAEARRWKRKFSRDEEVPVARDRRYPHPLLGSLFCNNCGQHMIGGGPATYVCRHHSASSCSRPQTLNERIAMTLLEPALGEALAQVVDLAGALQEAATRREPSDDVLRLEFLEERVTEMSAGLQTMRHVPPSFYTDLSNMQEQIEVLQAKVADEVDERMRAAQTASQLRALQNQPLEVLKMLPPDRLAQVYALLFKRVVIGCEGRATARRWWLAEYRPRFGDALVRLDREHAPTLRQLPPASAKRLGMDWPFVLSVPPRLVASFHLDEDSAPEMSAYLEPLLTLSAALSSVAVA